MPSSVIRSVPARLLLPREQALLYLEWQDNQYPDGTSGNIGSAMHYHQFRQYLGGKSKPSKHVAGTINKTHIAAECGHELHPSDTMTSGYCPVCEVQMCLAFLDAIAKELQNAGGPGGQSGPVKRKYVVLRQGWHMARLQLQEVISLIEVSATYEAQWEAVHPKEVTAAQETNTCTKALRLAEMEHKYPAVVSKTLASGTNRKSSDADRSTKEHTKSKKKVTFAPATNFKPGRHNEEYHRGSRFYQPGAHAASRDNVWLNASQCGSTPADICNLKLFVTSSKEDFDKLDANLSYRPGQLQGLVGSHPGASVISDFVQNFQEQKEGGMKEINDMVRHADAMIVLVNGDNVLDVHFSCSEDVEDEDYDDEEVDQSRWICLREIMACEPK